MPSRFPLSGLAGALISLTLQMVSFTHLMTACLCVTTPATSLYLDNGSMSYSYDCPSQRNKEKGNLGCPDRCYRIQYLDLSLCLYIDFGANPSSRLKKRGQREKIFCRMSRFLLTISPL
ncbi:hypothetical protein BDV26DRAFT_259856 [Aspergillus bertholletiae]|uniref:Secreted protein n=1 Tax=Aspergillus bertholletiae TaxID=1226010 RepID=A0A5N7BC07_9EURO|nr:hypothetical protein BDV26DRAFT_259856 [Aspergillus bertholletiae]